MLSTYMMCWESYIMLIIVLWVIRIDIECRIWKENVAAHALSRSLFMAYQNFKIFKVNMLTLFTYLNSYWYNFKNIYVYHVCKAIHVL